jgi:DHA1 family multidrug resistance protein-like MFS transporter
MAAESAPPDRTAYAIGTIQTAQRLGPAVGPVIGGVVAQMVGLRNAFLMTSGFYVVALGIVFFLYDERHARPSRAAAGTAPIRFKSVLAFENFILLMAVIFGLQLVDRSYGPILPLYVAQLGTPAHQVPLIAGIIFSVAAGAGAIGNQLCTRLLRWRPARTVMVLAALTGACGAALFALTGSTAAMFVATPVLGLALGVSSTAAYTAASGVIPANARGAGFGLLTTASLVALALSPMLSGFLAATSIRAVFILDVAIMLVIAAAVRRHMSGERAGQTTAPVTEEI